jgi:small-conductance mechanosensitive channel
LKELLNFIKDFLISISIEVNDNGEKGILYVVFILIGLVIFISPGYILIFFYKENMVSNDYIVLNLFSTIIIDSVFFGVLFIIGLARGIRIPKESKEHIVYNNDILIDMVITIILMGTISAILIFVFAIVRLNKINWTSKIGIITFIITTAILSLKYIYSWIRIYYRFIIGKVRYKKAKEKNNKVNQINNDLPDDDDDEI